jgi:hypothetical protein
MAIFFLMIAVVVEAAPPPDFASVQERESESESFYYSHTYFSELVDKL